MRAEVLDKVEAVVYIVGGIIYHCADIDSTNELKVSVELKRQERHAEEQIRSIQKQDNLKEDGYFVSAGIVYKVFHNNTVVKKITGDEAKAIKRKIKLDLRDRVERAIDKAAKKIGHAKDERFALEA